MPELDEKTPEQIAAEAAEAEKNKPKTPLIDTETARAMGDALAEGLDRRAAAREKAKPAEQIQEPDIETIDPAEIDRRIAKGEPIADLIAKFGAGVEERTRRAVAHETGTALNGLQDALLNQARTQIEHFKDYEAEILEIVGKVRPANRTFKVYQDATAMVLGRPDVRKKLEDARVAIEIEKVTKPKKETAGAAESGGASRLLRPSGDNQQNGELAPTEENLRVLVGEDAFHAFVEMKRTKGWTLDSFAQRQGYTDAAAWFKRAQENDRRTAAADGFGGDVNWIRDENGQYKEDKPWVTGISR